MDTKVRNKFPNRLPPCAGRNIRKYRLMRNISGRQLAALTGVSPSFISCLECGKRNGANYPIIKAIANALGCSVQSIMEEDFEPMLTPEERRENLLELLEKILKSEDTMDDKTIRKLEIILKIKENLLKECC